jgi:hypothetical protein
MLITTIGLIGFDAVLLTLEMEVRANSVTWPWFHCSRRSPCSRWDRWPHGVLRAAARATAATNYDGHRGLSRLSQLVE